MTRVHAFTADEALTDLDATCLVAALRADASRSPRLSRRPSLARSRSTPPSAPWRTPPTTAPATRRSTRVAAGSPGVPTFVKDNVSGLPHGMMLGAGAGCKARLLGLALELEEAVGWPRIQAA